MEQNVEIEKPEVMEEPKSELPEKEKTQEPKKEEPNDPKWKADLHRFKQEKKELEAQNQKLLREIQEKEEKTLQEKGRYKDLFESEKQKRMELEGKVVGQKDAFFNTLKRAEIEKAAIGAGIRKEALYDLDLLDNSLVEIETTDKGSINILGAEEFVSELKNTRPYWFQGQGAPNVNTGNPSYRGEKSYSASELLKLQRENPAKYREELKKRLK